MFMVVVHAFKMDYHAPIVVIFADDQHRTPGDQ